MTTLQQPQHRPTRFLQQQTWMILLAIAVVLMLMPSLACAQNTTCSSQTLSDPEWPDTLEQTACITPGVSGTVETDNDSYDGNLDDLTVYGVAAEGVVTDSLGDVLFDSGMQDGDISATGGSSEVVEVPFEGEAYTLTGLANDCTWSPDAFSEDNFNYYNFQILCWDNSFPGASVSIPPVPLYSYTITPSGGSSGYAANGNLLSYTDSVNGTWSFGYDQLNRVTTANNSLMPSGEIWAQNFCWAYDSFGNRLQQTTSNVAFSAGTSSCTPSGTVYQNTWATFNAQNRMTSTNAPGWTITPPAYDGAGDVTNDGTNGYLYDAEGRICATHTGEGYFGYIYDAAGNRVAKGTISSTNWSCDVSTNGFALTEWYILGPSGEQLTETDGSGNWKHTNVYAAGQLIATYEASTNDTVFALTDWLGTKRVESGANGCATAYTGLPFGDGLTPVAVSGYTQCPDDATEHHFTGKERDTESGNDYFGARYYGSSMGRFMSPDWSNDPSPVPWADTENPQSLNLYAYVNNNPLSNRDPNGHKCDPDTSSVGPDGTVTVTAGKCYVDPIPLALAFGHHFIDQAIVKSEGAGQSLAGRFFNLWRTGGPLKNPGVHTGYPKAARLNTQQIQKIVDDIKQQTGRDMSQWTEADIEKAVDEVRNAGGDTGKFLSDIAEENPTVRTAGADIQDLMSAAQNAYNSAKGAAGAAVEDVETTCESEPNCGLPPP